MKKLVLCLSLALVLTGAMSASAQTSSVAMGTSASITSSLSVGSQGSAVTTLQEFLITKGYLHAASPSGYFGNLTSGAVSAFQAANDLPQVGRVGPKTLVILNQLLGGSNGGALQPQVQSSQMPAPTINGCAARNVYNTITGALCGTPPLTIAGCAAANVYNSITGAPCNNAGGSQQNQPEQPYQGQGQSQQTLTVTEDTTFANQTVAPNTNNQEIASYTITDNGTENITLNSLNIAPTYTTVTASDFTTVNAESQNSQHVLGYSAGGSIAPVTLSTNGFDPTLAPGTSETISFFGGVGSAPSGSVQTMLEVTGTGQTTGNTYTSSTATGQTITIGSNTNTTQPATIITNPSLDPMSSTATSAFLTGQLVSGYWSWATSSMTQVWFNYGTSSTLSGATTTPYMMGNQVVNYQGLFTTTVNSLQSNTTYYYQACAQSSSSSNSQPVCGSIDSFTTGTTGVVTTTTSSSQNTNGSVVTNPSGAGPGYIYTQPTTAMVYGQVANNVWGGSYSLQTRFNYGTSPTLATSTATPIIPGMQVSAQGYFNTNITNLQPSTTYYYQACAGNASGSPASACGAIVPFTTQ